MLNTQLWLSFDKILSEKDVQDIEKRLCYLREIVEGAILGCHSTVSTTDVRGDLDLGLHIYFEYFKLTENDNLSPWLIHNCWFYYYNDGKELSPELKRKWEKFYVRSADEFCECLGDVISCLDDYFLIKEEADAVTWLSLLDYLALKLLEKIGRDRLKNIFI